MLGILQPFETLKHGTSLATVSLNLGYTSLPPQLTTFQALRNKHYLLAGISTMTIIADILPVASSGLFFENVVSVTDKVSFQSAYELRFQRIGNTTLLPNDQFNPGDIAQRNLSPIYMAMSNLTAGTPMPPWTDDNFAYIPFVAPPELRNTSWAYRANTSALGAILFCAPLESHGGELLFDGSGKLVNVTATIDSGNQNSVACVSSEFSEDEGFANINALQGFSDGLAALEVNGPFGGLDPSAENATICRNYFFASWIRANTSILPIPTDSTDYDDDPLNITSMQQTAIVCQPQLLAGTAEIVVDSDGRVQQVISTNVSSDNIDILFDGDMDTLLYQTNLIALDVGATWHSDAFPSDFDNYLIEKMINSSRFLDYNLPPPSSGDGADAFSALYSKLFAITIGTNMGALLASVADNETISGTSTRPTIRIFVSKPMVILSETILGLYGLMTIIAYLQRPWKILPRLPTNPASVIAFFAASHAIQDFTGTAHMSSAERAKYLAKLGNRYGFGSFIGTDGKPHVGIEKLPYVVPLDIAESKDNISDMPPSGTLGKEKRKLRRRIGLHSRSATEGGWF